MPNKIALSCINKFVHICILNCLVSLNMLLYTTETSLTFTNIRATLKKLILNFTVKSFQPIKPQEIL